MNAQSWIAMYAALVSTGTLIWQVITYWTAHRPRLEVDLLLCRIEGGVPEDISHWGILQKQRYRKTPLKWVIVASITNKAHAKTQVASIALDRLVDEKKVESWDIDQILSTPFWLDPGERKEILLDDEDVYEAPLEGVFRFTASTGTGKRFKGTTDAEKDGVVMVHQDTYEALCAAIGGFPLGPEGVPLKIYGEESQNETSSQSSSEQP